MPRLDHVQIAAPPGCETDARRFYGELLGLEELEKPAPLRDRGGVWFALTGAQLHVGVEDPFVPARKAHAALAYTREGYEAVLGRLGASGTRLTHDRSLPGVTRCYVEDPWGNRLELLAPG